MKKVLAIFLALVSGLSFFVTYKLADEEEHRRVEKAAQGIGKAFWIPDHPLLSKPEEAYPLLVDAARESKVNVFRTNVHYDDKDHVETLEYVLLAGHTHFFEAFRLKDGRPLSPKETQVGNQFISTEESNERNQVGVIGDFAGNDRIVVKSLKAAYDYLPVGGQYFVEAADGRAFDGFIDAFVGKINMRYAKLAPKPFVAKDFTEDPINHGGGLGGYSRDYLAYIALIIFLITLILVVYYMFFESKQIGIMKMHGLSSAHIWYLLAGRLIGFVFLSSVVVSALVASTIKDATLKFILDVVIGLTKIYLMALASSVVAYVYISKIKISDTIKNRKDTDGVFALNAFLKAGASILLIVIGMTTWSSFMDIRDKLSLLKNWEQSKDYGVFYPVNVGYDLEEIQRGSSESDIAKAVGLYPVLNSMGAVFADANEYREGALPDDFDPSLRSIVVNPNYLSKYPVRDTNNNQVRISENTSDWILLVPEIYHNSESKIRAHFQTRRAGGGGIEGNYQAEEAVLKRKVPESVRKQRIKIIWTASGQKVFSFNPTILPKDNNLILNPIIQVATMKNSLGIDRSSILNGGGGDDPLKVKLINNNTQLTLAKLKPELKRLKLDDNLVRLVAVDEYVLDEVRRLQVSMEGLFATSIAVFAGLLILVVQNLIIFFDKYQRKFVVRRLFGVDFFKAYKEFFRLFSVSWLLQLLISYAIALKMNLMGSGGLLLIVLAVVLAELVASAIALAAIEKKSRAQVLKGGA